MGISRIHHVLVAIPPGSEQQARGFYGGVLGLAEVPKPSHLARRGGVWYRCGRVDLHLGGDAEFRPARKAHPAFRVSDLGGLRRRLEDRGVRTWKDEPSPGHKRVYAKWPLREKTARNGAAHPGP
jgi:catechol 2,3-dioxygenase-like lactoylglutathione lyase family enzyme